MKVKYVGFVVLIICLLCIAPVAVYVYFMWYKFGVVTVSSSNSDWSSFGSYLGGILSPLFTLLSVGFIYYSVKENNSNHKTEMRYMNNQQVISMVSSLADAFNAKLDSAVNLAHPRVAEQDINIYEVSESEEIPVGGAEVNEKNEEGDLDVEESEADRFIFFQVPKTALKLSEFLENHLMYGDRDRDFSWQYVNLVNVLTFNVIETFGVALSYMSALGDSVQRKEAVTLFAAKTNSSTITVLMHVLADRFKYSFDQGGDILDLECFFADAASLSNFSDDYKYSSVPFLKRMLLKLAIEAFETGRNEARFKFDRECVVVVQKGEVSASLTAGKILNGEVEIDGVTINLRARLQTPIRDFRPHVSVEYHSKRDEYEVKIKLRDVLGLSAIMDKMLSVYVLTFTLDGLIFKLKKLKVAH